MKKVMKDLLIISADELNIKSRNGNHVRSTCPECSATRGNPGDPSLAVDLATGVGYCHHCGTRFKIDDDPLRDVHGSTAVRRNDTDGGDMRRNLLPLDEETTAYLLHRGISADTARRAGVCSRVTFKGGMQMHWAAFPFAEGTGVVNVQYKLADTQQKQFFFEPGGRLIPWNAQCIARGDGTTPLYITEGMVDALALMECGAEHVVSVPNGANSSMAAFDAYRTAIGSRFSHIVFAGDTDEQGLKLRRAVTEYFSDMDVCAVTWRHGGTTAKDADELLMSCGKDAVRACTERAVTCGDERMVVMGTDNDDIDRLFAQGMPLGNGIGLGGFDDIVHLEPGHMLLITGYPGAGKSSMVNFMVVRLLLMYGWRTVFFSPEKMPAAYHEAELISIIAGQPFDSARITRADFEAAKNILRGNIMHISDEVGELPDIVRLAERAVRLYSARVLVIDPFVYLSMPAVPGSSDTQKIAEMLKEIMLATRRLNIVVILVAHPRKPSAEGTPSTPSLYEVAGSANFYNFCDCGIIMERDMQHKEMVRITCGKARQKFLGQLGTVKVAYDDTCGRYAECLRDRNGAFTNQRAPFDRSFWHAGKESEYTAELDYYAADDDEDY